MSIAKPHTPLIGIINQGFAAVNRRLWVVAIPVLLNLYLWYGAQVSLRPLVESIATLFQRLTPDADRASATAFAESWRNLGNYDLADRFDVLALVPRLTMYGIQRAQDGMPLIERLLPPLDQARVAFSIGDGSLAVLLFLLTNLLLIPFSAAFLTMVASAVLGQQPKPMVWLGQFGRATAAILGYGAILLAATVVITMPLALLGLLFVRAAPPLGLLVLLLLIVVIFWLNIYIGFAPEAIAVAKLDPIQAIRTSFVLVRRNFWATLALLTISLLISIGLGVVWAALVENALGRVAAILGSAYVGSGLVAARMVFYRERVKDREQVLANRS